MAKSNESNTMNKAVRSVGFDSGEPQDRDVMALVNEFSSLYPGIPALSLVRNHLIETLRERINLRRAEQAAQKTA